MTNYLLKILFNLLVILQMRDHYVNLKDRVIKNLSFISTDAKCLITN